MTFELAAFRVAPDHEAALVAGRPAMVAALRREFPGILAAWLTREDDGSWLDVILWRSRAEAEDAARRVDEIPEAREWFGHISESLGLRHIDVVSGYQPG